MDFFTKKARKKLLKQLNNAVVNTHKEGRLTFKGKDSIEFVTKDGQRQLLTLNACALKFYDMWNAKMAQDIGFLQGNLASFGIFPNDIEGMIVEVIKKDGRRGNA